jgi:4-amino-4-deoxy-L-arabinose transferase-like glycosyltransferase
MHAAATPALEATDPRRYVASVSKPLRIPRPRSALTSAPALLTYLGLLCFAAHMLVAGNYGYFRDELYYIADGHHLQAGYVDQPALVGWLAALMNVLSGDSLVAIHIIPALAAGALVVVTGLMARELGGGRFAQVLAALSASFALVLMATGSIFSMDVLDELWWTLSAFILIRLLKRDQPRLWLLLGLVVGIGLTTKLTMLFFGLALTIALLVTPERRSLRTPWPWLGGAVAATFLLPYVVWNALNGWPTWEFWHHYGGTGTSPLDFFANQILLMNPIAVPLAIAGLLFYFRRDGKPYRTLGWTFVILYALLTLLHVKPYFLAPAYPLLFAPGAVVVEQYTQRRRRAWLRPTYVATLAVAGLLLAPLAMPILPPALFASAYGVMTGAGNGGAGQSTAGAFPQYLGDRFGWDTLVQTVETAYAALPHEERSQACVLTTNYGEAGALALLGRPGRLPPVISGHNNYYLWGPGKCTGQVLIVIGYAASDLQHIYRSVVHVATNRCTYCMAGENNLPIFVCTHPQGSASHDLWRRFKHFD